ncbi:MULTISPECIES: YtpI family protein [Gracilibacillus]|uniref:YtpI-like protein n=1 Tax=Gracilibacillus dipsosauri TaxID=178340 RepID=A0A317L2D0_9BACI|nr:YtpI family protein [Gracilibacillus dipsosauri]PWU69170.1 hypothetical protein DLJ74_06655 [Gracilibacillus dipsosauri]
MVVFPIVIIISIVLYVYYKVMILRGSDPLIQEILNAKARISLGIFISFFGVNQYLYYQTKIALYVAIVFLIFGLLQMYTGIKRYQHYKSEQRKRKENI